MSNKSHIDELIMSLYHRDETIVNDETRLLTAVFLESGWDYELSLYENLRKMPHPETVARRRRTLHSDGKIKYSEAIEHKRYKHYKEITSQYSNTLGGMPLDFIPTEPDEKR